MDIYFLILIIATGIITTTTDISLRKIKNEHLLIICSFSLVLYAIFLFLGTLKISSSLILNPLVGLSIGFILYLSGIWKAGDAKLFATYCLLLPINPYQDILPLACLALFANTFLISFMIIFLFSLYGILKNKNKIIGELFSRKTAWYFGKTFFILLGLSWVLLPIIALVPFQDNTFFSFIIFYLGYSLLFRFIGIIKKTSVLAATIAAGLILRYLLTPGFFTMNNILSYIKLVFVYSGVFYILRIITSEKGKTQVRIPFAPFIFLGTILINTPFLLIIMRLLLRLR